jgi:hypothetical protein
MNLFDRLDEWINNTEGSLVNALTAFAPWIAPAAPAYMTYQHMVNFLDFPQWLAIGLALLVEILGFGTVSTGLDFWFYNRRERAGNKKAPLGIIIGTFIFYLVLIMVSNVVIDIANAYLTEGYQKGAIILVRALLTLQTIPGALIVASRTGHRDLLKEIKKEKDSKLTGKFPNERVESSNENGNLLESSKKVPSWRSMRPQLSKKDLESLANLTPDGMRSYSSETGYTYKTISNWRMRAKAELGMDDSESN